MDLLSNPSKLLSVAKSGNMAIIEDSPEVSTETSIEVESSPVVEVLSSAEASIAIEAPPVVETSTASKPSIAIETSNSVEFVPVFSKTSESPVPVVRHTFVPAKPMLDSNSLAF